jgi:hypothetical protein
MVKSVKLMRVGLSDDQTLTNAYLYDGMTRVAGPASVSRDGSVMFSSYNGLFAVAGSKTLTVRGDIKSNLSGQTIGFAVASIDTGAGMTSLSNVTGPILTIGSVGLASVAVTSAINTDLPAANPGLNAGSMAQNVWERAITVSTRDVKLSRATFKMIGSAPYSSLANVNLNVDGANVAQGSIDMNGYISFAFPTQYTLTTGSHTIKVYADVVGGAKRDFYVVLEQVSDILVEDSQVAGAFVTLSGNATSNMKGGQITINGGNFTVTQDTSLSNITTLVGGATNQSLAKWKFSAYGEDVKVLNLSFMPTVTTQHGNLTNVGLYVNGGQVRSNQTATNATLLNYTDLGTNLVIPAGQTVAVELRGDLVSSTGVTATSGIVKFDLQSNASGAQGMVSQNITSVPGATGQSFTVGNANVNFALAAGTANRTVSPNTANVKIGSYSIQTGSAEGVNVTSFSVGLSGTLYSNTKISNLTIKDGSTVIGNVIGLPSSSNTFSANVNVPVSSTKTFDVYADVQSGSSGMTVTPSITVYYTGLASRQTGNLTAGSNVTITSNTATIAASGITFVPASSPVAQFVLGGTTGLNIATFNVKNTAGIGGATLKDLTFTVPTNTVGSLTVNGKTATVVGTTATVYDSGIVVPSDASGVNIPVTASLVCVGSSNGCAGNSNTTVTVQLTSITYNNGETVVSTTTSPVAVTPNHVLVASRPTLTMAQSATTGFGNGIVKIGEFTASADAAGDIELAQLPVSITTTASGSNFELRDSTGATVITGVSAISGSGNFVFTTPRKIAKGTSETYTVYGTFSAVSGAAGTQSVTFGLGAKGNFQWNDVVGGVTGITGTNLNTYPNTTQSKTN